MLLLLLACARPADLEALQARVDALEQAQALDQLRIQALETQLSEREPSTVGASMADAAEWSGPVCQSEANGFILPPSDSLNEELLRQAARMVPHRGADGEMDGYRISGVRRGSLLDTCGVRNGDIAMRIGGAAIRNTDELSTALKALPAMPSFALELVRRGEPTSVALRWP